MLEKGLKRAFLEQMEMLQAIRMIDHSVYDNPSPTRTLLDDNASGDERNDGARRSTDPADNESCTLPARATPT